MKNLKRNKYIIFMSNTNIAFVALNIFNNETNVLFADQIEVSENNIASNLSYLLTNAANFLGFNIKHADLVFEDYDINVKLINKEFVNCASKEDITRQIYREAKRNNNFVNNIIYSPINFDSNKAHVICKALVSKYSEYNKFKNAVKYNNVKIDNCINIATLLNTNDDGLVLNLIGKNAYACHYAQNNLVNCYNLNVDFTAIANKLAKEFNVSVENISKLVNITKYISNNDDLNIDLSWNYDLKNRELKFIKADKFIEAWRNELKSQINDCLLINNWQNTKIITDNSINNLNSTSVEHEIIGLDNLSLDKILCVLNVNRIKDVQNQSNYDLKIEESFERIIA